MPESNITPDHIRITLAQVFTGTASLAGLLGYWYWKIHSAVWRREDKLVRTINENTSLLHQRLDKHAEESKAELSRIHSRIDDVAKDANRAMQATEFLRGKIGNGH